MEKDPKTNLFTAAYEGRMNDIVDVLEKDNTLISSKDSNERMLIHWAALGGHTDLVQLLLRKGSPIDPQDDTQMTPLILASSAGRNDVVRLLIGAGAGVNSQNVRGNSPLQYAASKGWKDIVKLLLDNGAQVNICDVRGARPLHRASSLGHLPVVALLLSSKRIEINAKDSEGNTPLHLSCEEDRGDVARLLVEHGAQLDAVNKDSKTPLDVASMALAKLLRSLMQT